MNRTAMNAVGFPSGQHEHAFHFCTVEESMVTNTKFVVLACHCGEVKFIKVPAE